MSSKHVVLIEEVQEILEDELHKAGQIVQESAQLVMRNPKTPCFFMLLIWPVTCTVAVKVLCLTVTP